MGSTIVGEVVIEFHPPADLLSMNKMPTTGFRQKQWRADKNAWKDAAYFAGCAAFPGVGPEGRAMPPCDVYVSLPVPGNYHRDPHNYEVTAKPIVDGLVMAGVWADDTPEYVNMKPIALRPVSPGEWLKHKVIIRLVSRGEM